MLLKMQTICDFFSLTFMILLFLADPSCLLCEALSRLQLKTSHSQQVRLQLLHLMLHSLFSAQNHNPSLHTLRSSQGGCCCTVCVCVCVCVC